MEVTQVCPEPVFPTDQGGVCIDKRRRFERAYVTIRAVLVVSRCRFAVEDVASMAPCEPGSQICAGSRRNLRHTDSGNPRMTGTALRVRETPSTTAVTLYKLDPSHSPNPRFRGTSHPCERTKSGELGAFTREIRCQPDHSPPLDWRHSAFEPATRLASQSGRVV